MVHSFGPLTIDMIHDVVLQYYSQWLERRHWACCVEQHFTDSCHTYHPILVISVLFTVPTSTVLSYSACYR